MERSTELPWRLLLIDDDEDLREIFFATLSTIAGIEVVVAESGQVGLALAQAGHFDAILLDVMMPGMGGEAVLHELQTHSSTADIPVIFMTSRTHGDDRQHLLEIGGEAVISKACKAGQIATQILTILKKIYSSGIR